MRGDQNVITCKEIFRVDFIKDDTNLKAPTKFIHLFLVFHKHLIVPLTKIKIILKSLFAMYSN